MSKNVRGWWFSTLTVPVPVPVNLALRVLAIVTINVGLRSAGIQWYNGNGRRVLMVLALVWILTAVLFFTFFLDKIYKFLYKF